MAGIRLTGLVSGFDTESLIKQLSEAHQMKVNQVKKKQTTAEWKKDAWATLNTKLYDFYRNSLATFQSIGTYNAKKVNGTFSGVKVSAGTNAANGIQKVKVNSVAVAQKITGNKINTGTYTSSSYVANMDAQLTGKKISELYNSTGYNIDIDKLNGSSFTVSAAGQPDVEVTISGLDSNSTIDDLLSNINGQLGGTGLTADYVNGALSFTNNSATGVLEADGTTTYSGGLAITVKATDDSSVAALGISKDGFTVPSLPVDNLADNNIRSGASIFHDEVLTPNTSITGSSKLVDLGIADGTVITVNGKDITVDKTTTMTSFAKAMADTGIIASYDATQGRFYLNSKATGTDNAFDIVGNPSDLAILGLNVADGDAGYIKAENASITYNGVDYEQSTNSFSINGLTIEAVEAGTEQTFTVENDVEGVYNKIKNFVKEYNALIEEMNKLYGAERVKGYEPLTQDEKSAMSDEEIKQWEGAIKGSLLRRDSTISSLLSSMRTTLTKSVEVTNADGTTSRFSLASFGIVTGNYTERGKLHINGDKEDGDFAAFADKLMAALSSNPDAVAKTLSTIGNEMYKNLQDAMKRTETSRALTFYNDIKMEEDIEKYKKEVTKMQEKLQKEEDKYYKQFAAMETAMSKLQSQQTYVSQIFGGGGK